MTGHVAEKKNATSIMFEVISSYFISSKTGTLSPVKSLSGLFSIIYPWLLSREKTQRLAIIINNSNFFLFFFSVLVLVFVFVFPADVSDPPTDVKVISRGSRKLNISWTAGFNRNSAI